MYEDKKWNEFWNSGSVFDYLDYKNYKGNYTPDLKENHNLNEKADKNGNYYQGLSDKGTADGGE